LPHNKKGKKRKFEKQKKQQQQQTKNKKGWVGDRYFMKFPETIFIWHSTRTHLKHLKFALK